MRSQFTVFCTTVTLLSQNSLAETVNFGNRDTAFDIEFVEVGDPSNPHETIFSQGEFIDVGRVDYVYQIGKFEVSREMVTKMVKASSDIGLTLNTMEDIIGGPRPNMPATGVTWAEAARFVNWLNTSTGYDPAYNTFVSPGFRVWEPGDPGYDPSNPFRNSQAKFVLPSIDEWHKAAFFDPSLSFRCSTTAVPGSVPEPTGIGGSLLPVG